jgi:hypothetical protein
VLRLAADENLNNDILRALLRRRRDIDIVRVQDVGLSGAPDEAVLEWAAGEHRIVVTHDVTTMTRHAAERCQTGRSMPGLVQVPRSVPVARAADDLLLLAEASQDGEWEGQVLFLPL